MTGGTFNQKAPSFPFLDRTWRRYQGMIGLGVALALSVVLVVVSVFLLMLTRRLEQQDLN